MNYQQKYEQLLAEFEQYKNESVKWSVDDFLCYNDDYADDGIYITRERAQEALERMIRKHDAEYGISWQVVEFYFKEYAEYKSKYFKISGYYKDDKSEFTDFIVKEFDSADEHDEQIFYYGLSEADIKYSIDTCGDDNLEFVITSYSFYFN
jgi:hypothetical protein